MSSCETMGASPLHLLFELPHTCKMGTGSIFKDMLTLPWEGDFLGSISLRSDSPIFSHCLFLQRCGFFCVCLFSYVLRLQFFTVYTCALAQNWSPFMVVCFSIRPAPLCLICRPRRLWCLGVVAPVRACTLLVFLRDLLASPPVA